MERFINFNQKEMQDMLQKEMHSTGRKIDLNKLNIPVFNLVNNFPEHAILYDAKGLDILMTNKKCADFFEVTSEQELEGQTVSYLEKKKREKNPAIEFAHTVENELTSVLSSGKPKIFPASNPVVDSEGYCALHMTIRTPAFNTDGKIEAVLCINSDLTHCEQAKNLYNHYKAVYPNNAKERNKLFAEYLGLPIYENFILTTREIEVLISLAKHRHNVNAARELGISRGTIEGYIHEIKSKLRNTNLTEILLYFTTSDKRKF